MQNLYNLKNNIIILIINESLITIIPCQDKRLIKLESQCSTKSVLDYLRQQLEKNSKGGGGKGKGGKKITAKKAKVCIIL